MAMNDAVPAAAAEQRDVIEKMLAMPVRTAAGVMIRGLVNCLPEHQPKAVLNMIAWQVGYLLGDAFSGDVMTVMRLRDEFKRAFEQGLASAGAGSSPPRKILP